MTFKFGLRVNQSVAAQSIAPALQRRVVSIPAGGSMLIIFFLNVPGLNFDMRTISTRNKTHSRLLFQETLKDGCFLSYSFLKYSSFIFD